MLVGFVMGFFVFALIVIVALMVFEKSKIKTNETKHIKYEADNRE